MTKMTYEEWQEAYKPNKNHIFEEAYWNGTLFELRAEEWRHVDTRDLRHVWTLLEIGDAQCIVNGIEPENGSGYFVCAIPWIPGIHYEVTVASACDADVEQAQQASAVLCAMLDLTGVIELDGSLDNRLNIGAIKATLQELKDAFPEVAKRL